jgi:hypothetical protein
VTGPDDHPDLAHAELQAELNLGMAEAYRAAVDIGVEVALHGDGTGQCMGFLGVDPAVIRAAMGDDPATGPDPPALLDVTAADTPDDPGFVTRRSVMPAGNAWGGTPGQQAHMDGTCDPTACRYCATPQETP